VHPPVVDRRDRHVKIRRQIVHVHKGLEAPGIVCVDVFQIHTEQVGRTPPEQPETTVDDSVVP